MSLFKNLFYGSIVDFSIVLLSAIQQRDSFIHIFHIVFHIPFHYGLSQDTEYSSPCYTVGACVSILYIMVCIC